MYRPVILLLFLVFAGLANHSFAQQELKADTPKQYPLTSKEFISGQTVIDKIVLTGLEPEHDLDDRAQSASSEGEVRFMLRQAGLMEGNLFDLKTVQKAISTIKESLVGVGFIKASVTALGQALPNDGMTLVLSINKGPLITVSAVRFTHTLNFTENELIEALKTCLGDSWGTYDLKYIEYCVQKEVRGLMFSRGYFNAQIGAPSKHIVSNRAEISFDVAEGIRYRIGEIKIVGAKVFSEKEIIELLGQGPGDIPDGKALQAFVYEKLKRVYEDKGYAQYDAEFEPEYLPPPNEGLDATVNFKIRISEGSQFRVESIAFAGVDTKTARQLLDQMTLKANDIFSRTKLEEDIKKLNELDKYQTIDIDRDVDIRADEERHTAAFVITLRPFDN